jgi:glycosyltransferase involved in cell wall biosynthesis
MQKITGLWIGKTGDANSWYHIYPFAMARNTKLLHIVRHKAALKPIPNSVYHLFNYKDNFFDFLRFFYMGLKVLKRERIEYIVTFNPVPWGILAWLLAKIFNKPLIMGFIGTDFNFYLKKSILGKLLILLIKHTELLTVTGSNMINYLISQDVERENIYIYPHFVHKEWFEVQVQNEPTEYDLITICYLNKNKRIHDIINALEILHSKGYKLKFIILGDGPERYYLEELVRKKKLENYVNFKGYQEDTLYFLKKSKIYVQASQMEGLSLGLVEAMAAGLVPVTTVAGSEEDHIIDGVNGYFFKMKDYENLAEQLLKAIDKSNFNRLKNNVLKYSYHFSEEYAIKVCENILTKISKYVTK